MELKLDKSRPICPQICEQICAAISRGELLPESKLLSVREVALLAGVNPNTVQKSFEELERSGVIYSIRGSGWYVCADTGKARELLSGLCESKVREYISSMERLGFDSKQALKYINEFAGGKDE